MNWKRALLTVSVNHSTKLCNRIIKFFVHQGGLATSGLPASKFSFKYDLFLSAKFKEISYDSFCLVQISF